MRARTDGAGLVELRLHVGDALGDQVVGDLALGGLGRIFSAAATAASAAAARTSATACASAWRDLGLGHLGAAGDELFHLGLGLGGDPLGLGLGARR